MQLIGMLDSPYVRRVAISLQLLGLRFEHRSLSVFREFDEFRRINAVVKAPTLVCDDGTVLMDSTLILAYAEALARQRAPARSLMPAALPELQRSLQLIGLALAACEKNVQIIYERARPADKHYAAWTERVTGQMLAGLGALEAELAARPLVATTDAIDTIDQAGVTTAVTWHFIQMTMAGAVPAADFPALAALSAQAEALPAFAAAPHGDGTCTAGAA